MLFSFFSNRDLFLFKSVLVLKQDLITIAGTSERASPEANGVCGTAGTSTSEVKLDDNKFVVPNFTMFTK